MGVDFYICQRCKDTFPDCGPYESCENCGRHWCSSEYTECASKDGFVQSDETDEYGSYETSCNFCRGESAEDSDLLKFALKLLHTTRSKLEKKYLKSRG